VDADKTAIKINKIVDVYELEDNGDEKMELSMMMMKKR
jgi:hypothetical protein